MTSDLIFTERQKFTQWWLWAILLGINGLFLYGIFVQLVKGQSFGDNPMSDTGLILVTLFVLGLSLLFFSFRLDTEIRRDGIYVRFFPIHLAFKKYAWATIKDAHVRKYAAITEYGGWGLRWGLFGKGDALNISGNQGLQLTFHSNKKLLIGTQKPQEINAALARLKNELQEKLDYNS